MLILCSRPTLSRCCLRLRVGQVKQTKVAFVHSEPDEKVWKEGAGGRERSQSEGEEAGEEVVPQLPSVQQVGGRSVGGGAEGGRGFVPAIRIQRLPEWPAAAQPGHSWHQTPEVSSSSSSSGSGESWHTFSTHTGVITGILPTLKSQFSLSSQDSYLIWNRSRRYWHYSCLLFWKCATGIYGLAWILLKFI